ncbi:MAG: DUF1080 domain-containing protein [Bacteroidetes bacterium HGW-Bacteroidetes-13]|nr:MAG: DUF1080 domain-containing protein [Bacteroidetes bacterium HGW-Bacteroidetes-13]
MKKPILMLTLLMAFTACQNTKKADKETEITATTDMKTNEEAQWTPLFDGKSFDGWHLYLKEGVSPEWHVEDGAMVFRPTPESTRGNNIVTDKVYTDFVLSLEWKISEGGNSGLFWGVKEDPKYPEAYETGAEIQLLDDERHPDAKNGTTHKAGALYDMIAAPEGLVKPAGEWNLYVLEINHKANLGKLSINGKDAISFPLQGEAWDAMVAKSKFKDWPAFAKIKSGKIGLQDHGNEVAFRNLKIRALN